MYNIGMTKTVLILIAAATLAGCARTTPEQQVIDDAAEALGGAEQIQSATTLQLEGGGTNGDLGQNRAPDTDLPLFNVSELRHTIDMANRRARRSMNRVDADDPTESDSQNWGWDNGVAYNIDAKGMARRQNDMVARERQAELFLHHPLPLVRTALADTSTVSNRREEGGTILVDITTAQGEMVTLGIDGTSHLPVLARSMFYHPNLGDSLRETTFAEYQEVSGLQLPARITTKVDRYPVADLTLTRQGVNAAAEDISAPADVRSAEVPAPVANVTVQEVAPGVWWLAGQSHHSVLVEFSDHLELVEVPQSETRALAVIARARELRPGKPLTKAVVTHHHFDHSGGIRAAIAEGLTLVTHERNRALFEELAKRPHTIVQDALARNPREARIETVADDMTVKDAMRSMRVFHVIDGTGHSDSMLAVYLPNERILVQGDLFNSQGPNPKRMAIINTRFEQLGLQIQRHVPIHGAITPHTEYLKIMRSAQAAS